MNDWTGIWRLWDSSVLSISQEKKGQRHVSSGLKEGRGSLVHLRTMHLTLRTYHEGFSTTDNRDDVFFLSIAYQSCLESIRWGRKLHDWFLLKIASLFRMLLSGSLQTLADVSFCFMWLFLDDVKQQCETFGLGYGLMRVIVSWHLVLNKEVFRKKDKNVSCLRILTLSFKAISQ